MKRFILPVFFILAVQSSFAQGVGIFTTSPDPSAALEVKSDNKGILLPRVSLTGPNDGGTIPSPANALLIYNSNAAVLNGAGFYFNSGTSVTPQWKSLAGFALPFYAELNNGNALFHIKSVANQPGDVAIKGEGAGNATGLWAKSETGTALRVEGSVRITGAGQSPKTGKALMTDNFGIAKWDNPIPQEMFKASGLTNNSLVLNKNVDLTLPLDVEEYDLKNRFDLANNVFTASENGIYHFDAQVTKSSGTANLIILLNRIRNGSKTVILMTESTDNTLTLSTDTELQSGDQIFLSANFIIGNSFVVLNGLSRRTSFSGRLISVK